MYKPALTATAICLAVAASGCSEGFSPPSPPIIVQPPPAVVEQRFEGGPLAIAAGAGGAIYFSAQNVVYTFDAEGKARVVAGNGTAGYSGDGGPATQAQLNFPASHPLVHWLEDGPDVAALALDADGRLLVADASNNRVRRVDRAGLISTIANFSYPRGIAIGPDGSLYIAGNGIQRHAPDGRVDTVYQPGTFGVYGGIAVDALGDLFLASNCQVFRLVGSTLVRIAGKSVNHCGYDVDGPDSGAALNHPQAVAIDLLGNVLIADTYNNCIRKLDRAGVLSRFAGRCGDNMGGFSGDGAAAVDAYLSRPHGVAADSLGNVYIADTSNWRIRKVDVNGVISIVGEVPRPAR